MSVANNSYVHIEEDGMLAWLFLMPPEGKSDYTKEEIYQFLKENGVQYGFHESNIAAVLKKHIYKREIKIAKGTKGSEGKEGYFEYHFTPTSHQTPKVREDGSVDYASMHMLQNVAKGEKIATYHKALQGEDGIDVKGNKTPAKVIRELTPLRGRNIQRIVEEDIYVSMIDGKVTLEDGKIDIQSQHEIMGDVTLITSKIEFYGDVIINGNVEAGVTIRAGRNVIIKGMAEAIDVNAGGDIVIEKGINGGQKAKLSAKGNVFADYMEYVNVVAGGDVQANVILNSEVTAKGKVILTGKRGSVIGGFTNGFLGIEATNIGNDMEVPTILHAGYQEETYDKYLEYMREENKILKEFQTMAATLTELLKLRQAGGSAFLVTQQTQLISLIQKKNDLVERLNQVKSEKAKLNEEIVNGQDAKIKAAGKIFRGVTLSINRAIMRIERNDSFMIYRSENNEILTEVVVLP